MSAQPVKLGQHSGRHPSAGRGVWRRVGRRAYAPGRRRPVSRVRNFHPRGLVGDLENRQFRATHSPRAVLYLASTLATDECVMVELASSGANSLSVSHSVQGVDSLMRAMNRGQELCTGASRGAELLRALLLGEPDRNQHRRAAALSCSRIARSAHGEAAGAAIGCTGSAYAPRGGASARGLVLVRAGGSAAAQQPHASPAATSPCLRSRYVTGGCGG